MNRGLQNDRYLLFRSLSCIGALPLKDVREIMRPLAVERIASAPTCVLGVAIVRGLPAPVIDAAQLLNPSGDRTGTSPTRFISLRLGTRSACLAVDGVLDVRELPPHHLHQTPALLDETAGDLLPMIGALDAELLVVLNAARLVPESVWSSMQVVESGA